MVARQCAAAGSDERTARCDRERSCRISRQPGHLEAKGSPITLPDGTTVPRLPGFRRWIWDGEAVGSIGLRWQRGTSALPPHVLGHIGYAVVPWKEGRGYATEALRLMLGEARAVGLDHVEITTDLDNLASQKVILANGGILIGRFAKVAAYGGAESLKYRIDL